MQEASDGRRVGRRPRRHDALRAAKRRFLRLGIADQLEFHLFTGAFLGRRKGRRPAVERDVVAQVEALRCLRTVAAFLRTAAAPTASAYRAAWRGAGASMSATAIIGAFGSWQEAKLAYANGRLALTASQRALIRASMGRRREFCDYVDGVRRFLDQEPPPSSETRLDYDAFVDEWNDRRPIGEAPLVKAITVVVQTGLTWEEIKAVARGELPREEALGRVTGDRRSTRGDFGEFVGRRGVAVLLDQGYVYAGEITLRPDFPAPVAHHAGRRIWRRSDVIAYRDGHPVSPAVPVHLVFAAELRARLGLAKSTIALYVSRSPHRLPPVDGRVTGAYYWLPSTVDSWLSTRRSSRRNSATSDSDGN